MNWTTIEIGGTPMLIALPADQGDLDRYIAILPSPAGSVTYRPATVAEEKTGVAELLLHLMAGDELHRFFGARL